MKKAILVAIIIIGMLSWTVYDFVDSNNSNNQETYLYGEPGTLITSPISDEEEQVMEADGVGLEKGDIAPDFKLETLQGKTLRLSDYRGKRVMVNFWATWCPPCREEMPDMQKLYENKDIEILAVNLTATETSLDDVENFVLDLGLTFPVLKDVDNDIAARTYKIAAYPTSYMIDTEGRIQFVAYGALTYELMVQQLEKMK